MTQNVPHDEWLALVNRSRALLERSRFNKSVWRELGPLNQRIRRLSLMPTTKDSWPTRTMPEKHP